MRIEDYGLIGDLQTAALVSRDGSVDWLCLPRFDSASCFSALLGDERHGRWLVAPADKTHSISRRYRPGTLVLETDFETAEGIARVIDFMPQRGDGAPQLVRIVEGREGRVPMRTEISLRPDYGGVTPWVELVPGGMSAAAGPDAFRLCTSVALQTAEATVHGEFDAIEGVRERFVLSWHPSFETPPPVEDAESALVRTEAAWRDWSDRCTEDSEYRDEVLRSLIVLKGMTHELTGALVAAPTTSLPEEIGAGETGTIVSAGSETRRFLSPRCSASGTPRRHSRTVTTRSASSPATRPRCRSCTGWAASGG